VSIESETHLEGRLLASTVLLHTSLSDEVVGRLQLHDKGKRHGTLRFAVTGAMRA
jgi:hypothetical protein